MGLGPPVCTMCLVVGTLDNERVKWPWYCSCCGDVNLNGSLFTYTGDFQQLIWNRTKLYANHPPMSTPLEKCHAHKATRPFMAYPNEEYEPNRRYRVWLEKNIGEQGIKWNWEICQSNLDILEIYFADKEHGTLFELTWP